MKEEGKYKLAIVGATGVVRKNGKGSARRKKTSNIRIRILLIMQISRKQNILHGKRIHSKRIN